MIPPDLRSKLSPEDVLQDIARTLLRTSLQVSYTESEWYHVLGVIAMRQLRKQIRIARRSPPLCDTDVAVLSPEPDPGEVVRITDFISNCTDRQKRLIGLRAAGFTIPECAAKEGLHAATVRRQLAIIEQKISAEADNE